MVHGAGFAIRVEARAATVEYIDAFSYSKRRRPSLVYVSPAEYERNNR